MRTIRCFVARTKGSVSTVAPASRLTQVLAALFAFLCFFPYPAVSLGASTGLQANHLVAFALVPFMVLTRLPMRHIAAVGALVSSLFLAGFAALLLGNGVIPGIMIKAMIAVFIAAIVLIPAGYFALPANVVPILAAASFATLIHFAVGVYQEMSYARSDFPFLGFYQNPSFSSVAEMSEDYALWIKRPFGLFPEPSAMTASLGPWLIVIAGVFLNYRLRAPIRPATRVLLLLALVCVPLTGSMSSTNRGLPSAAGTPRWRPRRWPMVKPYVPVWLPTVSPVVASTMSPPWLGARSPSFSRSQPALSPSATKQMSWESGLSATSRPRDPASRRTARLVGVAQREEGVPQLLLVEHAEDVGLVLGVVGGAVHLDQPVGARCAAARSARSPPRRSPGRARGRGRRRT